jgi:type I restriction enzyme S subunit
MSTDQSGNDLPERWQVKRLSELCEPGKDSIVDGPFGSNLKRADFIRVGIPVLKLQNIKPNSIITKNMDYVSQEKFEKIIRHSFRLGDIVMTKLGDPLGVSAIVSDFEQGVIVADLVRIRPQSIDTKFLCYQLNSPNISRRLNDNQKGTTRPRINLSIVRDLEIRVPPLDEQEKIVEILEEQLLRFDAATAAIEAVRTKAARFRFSMIESAIHGEMSEQFATAWDEMVLNDLVDAKSDIIDGPFGSNLKSEHYVASGARVIRLQNIGYGEFRDEAAFISFEHFDRLKKHNVQTGDLLFASLGENLPRTCLVPDLGAPAIVKADCIRVRLSKNVNSRYVLMATQALTARTWAAEQLHGLGRPRLGLGNIRQFPVRLPPIEGQNRIVEFLDAQLETSGRIEERCSEYLNRIVGLRRSLLHAAFCGNLTKEWREAQNG